MMTRFWNSGGTGGVFVQQSSSYQLLLSVFHEIIIKNLHFQNYSSSYKGIN